MKKIIYLLKKEKKLVKHIVILIILIKIFSFFSGFSINMSPSIQRGVYLLYPKGKIEKGDIINFKIPDSIKEISLERNYLSKKIKTLTKYVRATENDIVQRKNNKLFINGEFSGKIYLKDQKDRTLNSVLKEDEEITLKKGEYFVLGIVENSLDSRYYGIIKEKDISKKAMLILKFK